MPSIISATTTNGVAVQGDNSGSLQLQTNNGTTAVTIDTSQNVGIGTSSPTTRLNVVNTSYSGSSSPYGIVSSVIGGTTLDNNWGHFVVSQASTTNGDGGKIIFGYGSTPGSDLNPIAAITASKQGDFFGNLLFFTRPSGGSNTERMRITSDGTICMGTTNTDPSGNGVNGLAYVGSASALTANRSGNACFFLGRSTSTGSITIFRYNTADVGNIATNGSNCTYNSTSDYRLKENITPISNALSRVAQLKPVTYTWKKDGSAGEGFIAHELAEVCPEAVTGEKDAVDEEGKPVYQAIDQSVLVATLTAAIQELKAELDATKAEVQALKEGK